MLGGDRGRVRKGGDGSKVRWCWGEMSGGRGSVGRKGKGRLRGRDGRGEYRGGGEGVMGEGGHG